MCEPCVAVIEGNMNFSKNRSEAMDDKTNTYTETRFNTKLNPPFVDIINEIKT